jgi:hypothetical protein
VGCFAAQTTFVNDIRFNRHRFSSTDFSKYCSASMVLFGAGRKLFLRSMTQFVATNPLTQADIQPWSGKFGKR